MAFPDYAQTSADHRRGLLMILQVGSKLPGSAFARIKDRIFSIRKVSINKDGEASKNFRVRYTNNHPLENNEWGEFQLHRSLIGLICVGGYSSPQELCELSRFVFYLKSAIFGHFTQIFAENTLWKTRKRKNRFQNRHKNSRKLSNIGKKIGKKIGKYHWQILAKMVKNGQKWSKMVKKWTKVELFWTFLGLKLFYLQAS